MGSGGIALFKGFWGWGEMWLKAFHLHIYNHENAVLAGMSQIEALAAVA